MLSRALRPRALAILLGATALAGTLAFAQQPPPAPPAPPPSATQPPAPGQPDAGAAARAKDRAAFLDARLAAVKAGLTLNPDQDKLWPPVEKAVRDGLAERAAMRDTLRAAPPPADMFQRMRRAADMATARGQALRAFVDAAQPFYASLNDDQKRRLPMLTHGRGGEGFGRGGERFGREDGPRRGFEPGRQFGGGAGGSGQEQGWRQGRAGPGPDFAERERGWSDGWGDRRGSGGDRGWSEGERGGPGGYASREDGPRRLQRPDRRGDDDSQNFSGWRGNREDRSPF